MQLLKGNKDAPKGSIAHSLTAFLLSFFFWEAAGRAVAAAAAAGGRQNGERGEDRERRRRRKPTVDGVTGSFHREPSRQSV